MSTKSIKSNYLPFKGLVLCRLLMLQIYEKLMPVVSPIVEKNKARRVSQRAGSGDEKKSFQYEVYKSLSHLA